MTKERENPEETTQQMVQLFRLGVPNKFIAEAFDISVSWVIKRMRDQGVSRKRSKITSQGNVAALSRLWHRLDKLEISSAVTCKNLIRSELKELVGYKNLLDLIAEARVAEPLGGFSPYLDLLRAVFPPHQSSSDQLRFFEGKFVDRILEKTFLVYCSRKDRVPRQEFRRMVRGAVLYFIASGNLTRLELDEVDIQLIEQVLAELPEKERLILRLRFGLDGGDRQTYHEIGQHEQLNFTGNRAQQLLGRALKRLRHPGRSRRLKPLFYPLRDRLRLTQVELQRLSGVVEKQRSELQVLKDQAEKPRAMKIAGSSEERRAILETWVEELEMNVFAKNRLRGAGIDWVHQLVRKTGLDLLKIPSLGSATLDEISEVVRGFHPELRLGMSEQDIEAFLLVKDFVKTEE